MIEHSTYLIKYEDSEGNVKSFRHKTGVDFTILSKILIKFFSQEHHIVELMNYDKDFDLIQDSEPSTNLEGVIIGLDNFIEPESIISINNKEIKVYAKTTEENSGDFFSGIFPNDTPVFIFTHSSRKWQIELNSKKLDLENILYLKDKYHKYLIYETQIEDYMRISDPKYRPKMAISGYKPLSWEDVKEKVWLLDFKRDKRCYQMISYLEKINDSDISEHFMSEHHGNLEHIKKSNDNHKLYILNKKLKDKYLKEPIEAEVKKRKI